MEKQEIFDKIVEWECEAGEGFLDHFDGYLRANIFMFWCMGRRYINKENFALWEAEWRKSKLEAECANYYVCSEDTPYAIVKTGDDYVEEDWHKAYMIVAEFISESPTYIRRFKEFLESE
ncbi:hypothetical protein [Bacillus wiedmannii]|uniref:hypothetical protein n=1 Tax=Bacillus wiedmannii TaxID=1890302 RepID=UPI003D24B23B